MRELHVPNTAMGSNAIETHRNVIKCKGLVKLDAEHWYQSKPGHW